MEQEKLEEKSLDIKDGAPLPAPKEISGIGV